MSPTFKFEYAPKIKAIPLTPPKAILLGFLKNTTPKATINIPIVIIEYSFNKDLLNIFITTPT